jgi:Amt family ammonium transporter
MILGPREQDVTQRSEHTELMTFVGGSLLWVGWFGFNAGSALAAGSSAGMAMLVTHICASTCAFTWMVIEWVRTGKPTVIGVVSGAITGLVIITPAAGFVDQTGAFVMGLVGACACYFLVMGKNALGMDEKPSVSLYPDAFGVHGVAGVVGGFMTGLFANPAVGGVAGAFYQNGEQLGWQLLGMLITIGWTAVVTAIILLALKFSIGINAEQEPQQHKLPVMEEHPLQPAMQLMPMPAMAPSPMMMMPPHNPFQPAFHQGGFTMGSA